MDSTARLDYALFQLTPTRTRFDLVLFFRGDSEKLASGLSEPCISHLKYARDEISKGGYSITLRPPNHDAPWFTKATFERFVRFVSTPAVLERFVSLEREILQIEGSIQVNELSNTNVPGQLEQGSGSAADCNIRKSNHSSKGELEGNDDTVQEENSKIQLQRLLGTRIALLRKEQAMAYARGLVAGFEIDKIDDLISFADAYGASRLREACINFKELWKKKHADRLWIEELAAMEACSPAELSFVGTSGIVLSNETVAPSQNVLLNLSGGNLGLNEPSDASKSDSAMSHTSSDGGKGKKDDNSPASGQVPSTTAKVRVPMTWPNQLPQYMYGFQGPIQHMSPYQGYPFPPMQPPYAGSVQWPPNIGESNGALVRVSDHYRNHKSSSGTKEKFLNGKGSEYSEDDGQTESSDLDSGSDSDSNIQQEKRHSSSSTDHSYKKKHRKKSSRTVVIRNINYITPNKRNGEKGGSSNEFSSNEDEIIDEDSLKKKVDDAVGLLKKSHKSKSSNRKKGDSNKSYHVANGSNDASDQDFDDNSVADAPKRGKGNDNWDAFQNLLMRDEDVTAIEVKGFHAIDAQDENLTVRSSQAEISSATSFAVDPESKKVPKQRIIAADSFIVTESDGGSEGRVKLEDFENGENFRSVLKKGDSTNADLLFTWRSEESSPNFGDIRSNCAVESSVMKTAKGEDWFVANHSGKPENQKATDEQTIFDGDCILSGVDGFQTEKLRKDILIDDSFMVQARPATVDLYDSQWKTDMSMVADLTSASSPGDGTANVSRDKHELYDPDDLYMVLGRESEFESAKASWTVDYAVDVSLEEANKKCLDAEDKKLPSNSEAINIKNDEAKAPGKDAKSKVSRGSIAKSKSELIPRSRKPSLVSRPVVQKSKLEKEEEIRKKMEELVIQRQKRIAERTAASGLAPAASKKVPLESKAAKVSIKYDKNRTHSGTRETNRIGSAKIRAA